jgi:hypothetical protein
MKFLGPFPTAGNWHVSKIRRKYAVETVDSEINGQIDSDARKTWLKFGRAISDRFADLTI